MQESIALKAFKDWLVPQNLKTINNYFLTLNPIISIDKTKVIKKIEFTHPIYDMETVNAQKFLFKLQGVNNTWFC